MKLQRHLLALAAIVTLAAPLSASAAPISYLGSIAPNSSVTGSVVGNAGYAAGNSAGRDWWTFNANAGDVISIVGSRLDGALDLGFSWFLGTSSADESTFTYNSSFGGMSFIGFQDDNWGPNLPGPFSDPRVLNVTVGSTGSYSIAAFSVASGDCSQGCAYSLNVTGNRAVNAVPEPGTLALAGVALLGLAALRRRA